MARSIAPAIVIAAYDRPEHLGQLYASVAAAEIAAGTTLVISIDGGGAHNQQIQSMAHNYEWAHGPIRVIEHDHLGLVDHFLACGDLTEEYGAVIMLEDDLIVGPAFQRWVIAALDHADDDDRIAGVSLATPFFDGYRHLPFEAVLDGSDALFAQLPWYDGMAWTSKMWTAFRAATIDPSTPLHRSFDALGEDEWFPDAIRYLVQSDRYYLLPRHAHATNSGAPGAHFSKSTDYFQVPLSLRGPASWQLLGLDDALATYDDHLELTVDAVKRLVPELDAIDFVVDLGGIRDLNIADSSHVLTTRQVQHSVRSWGASMHPLVANVVYNVAGDGVRLARLDDVIDSDASARESLATLTNHATRGRTPSGSELARQLATGLRARLVRSDARR